MPSEGFEFSKVASWHWSLNCKYDPPHNRYLSILITDGEQQFLRELSDS